MKNCKNCGTVLKNNRSFFCSSKCFSEYQEKEYIKRWQNGTENGLKGKYGISNYIRNFLLKKNGCKCQQCGWGEVNKFTGKVPLEIHHKDGNYLNNAEENLMILCPNCHSLTETYKSHNKNGRKERKKYIAG